MVPGYFPASIVHDIIDFPIAVMNPLRTGKEKSLRITEIQQGYFIRTAVNLNQYPGF